MPRGWAAPARRGGAGKIINVASLLSFQGGITVPGYAAAKGGLVQLTKALANEWAAHGINVNAIAPGYMQTDNTTALREDPQRNRQITERIPAGRWGTPEDVAGAAVFLASTRLRLRARSRARRRRRMDGTLRTHDHRHRHRSRLSAVWVVSRALHQFVGPAALTAAGMIGAGAVATRLLAGAWFGFDLLWVAILVIPMVIFTLDSASRIGILSGGRGLLDMVRTDIGAWLAWVVFLPMALVNVVVNMSQMSAMVEGAYGALGMLPPAERRGDARPGRGDARADRRHGGRRGARRLQADGNDHDGAARRDPVCFIVVAIKGLLDWSTWPALAAAWCRRFPPTCRWSVSPERVAQRLHADHGDRRPGAAAGGAAVVRLSRRQLRLHRRRHQAGVLADGTNLGVVWGLFSVVVIVAGATALHAVYTGSGPTHLGVSHYSQIESIPVAGQVLGPAFPGALGFLAPRFFSMGLIAAAFTTLIWVSLTMTYFCLDIAREELALHQRQPAVQGGVRDLDRGAGAGRAVLAAAGAAQGDPRDGRQPGDGAAGGLLILYFVNRPSLGEYPRQCRPQRRARP